ncbi:MAG TPA: glycosyltransferase family 39 protein [Thermoanaerobaculia bacterium]|nr:glycosyltransferase family 39 protein [Thermoanaerobaculia bacterium]
MRREIWICIAASLAVRGWLTSAHRIDSDEPQHLHVAWAAAHGFVQYRDVFDNHLPLLHGLFAPVMALMPESSDVFLLMRLAIAPFALACAWLLYEYARPLWGERVAATAALAFSVIPPWLPKSVEFRNDTLWIFFWLAALVLMTRNKPLLAGLALGLAMLASIKTVPLILAHVLALATERKKFELAPAMRVAAGIALPAIATAVWMLTHGALDDMLYATVLFNSATPVHEARRIGGVVAFMFLAPSILWIGRRALHLTLFAIWYVVLLLCFWPIITPRDFLPLAPLFALAVAARWPSWRPFALVAIGIVAALIDARVWRGTERVREQFVDEVVRLTKPGDLVYDLKGENVFRRRPVFPIYEDVGRALTANGTLADTGPEDITRHGCCAAVRDNDHIPPRTRAFLNRHFIESGPLTRVCGTRVESNSFEIAVPQTYAVLARDPASVAIDGVPYRGPRPLRAGPHTLSRGTNERVTIVWWRASKEAS